MVNPANDGAYKTNLTKCPPRVNPKIRPLGVVGHSGIRDPFERGLQVEYGRAIQRFEIAHLNPQPIDCEDLYQVEADRVGAMG